MKRARLIREAIREKTKSLLLERMPPEKLAAALAIGFVLGCIPLVGIPTWLCVLAAMAFRLNMPALQVANYAAMPFQFALMAPFVRLGAWMTPALAKPGFDLGTLKAAPALHITHLSAHVAGQFGIMAAQALLAWSLLAIPMAVALTKILAMVLKRVPVLAPSEPG